MATLGNFNANDVDPAASFDPVPAGKYVAVITESEMKTTKSGNGHFLELTFELMSGQYKGRKLWARLNLDNPNPQAVQIARAELSAICRAVGVLTPQDSCELHNLPLCIKVACKKREDSDEIGNEIKGYEKKEAAFAGAPAVAPTAAPASAVAPVGPPPVPAAQALNRTPPWQR